MWFFSADWHLGHSNIIKYCKRPFLSHEEEGLLSMADRGVIPAKELHISQESTIRMTDTIIDSTNAVVGPDDSLVIIGDFCWTPRNDRFAVAEKFRNRINCKNLYLIWGNHDDRRILSPLFKACYDQYVFNIDGQNIFTSHYPCRSWDMAFHGSWDLYGHVHDLYGPEDNGDLMSYERQVYSKGFHAVLNRLGINLLGVTDAEQEQAVQDLLAVCASTKGVDLTVDVGVDNQIRGKAVPFGTPWSMHDLRTYMGTKKVRWDARKKEQKQMSPISSLKS